MGLTCRRWEIRVNFLFCIAENEEENPWEPFHVTRGLKREQSAVSLFAAEPPRGVSEHTAPAGKTVLETISFALATVWSYRTCLMPEAIVVLCPEHVKTIHRDGFYQGTSPAISVSKIPAYQCGIIRRQSARGRHTIGRELQRDHGARRENATKSSAHRRAISIFVAGGTAGKFFCRDGQLVNRADGQPDGDVSDPR